jgi:hypothetical protein
MRGSRAEARSHKNPPASGVEARLEVVRLITNKRGLSALARSDLASRNIPAAGFRRGHVRKLVQLKMRSIKAPSALSIAWSALCTCRSCGRVRAPRGTSGWFVQTATVSGGVEMSDAFGGPFDQSEVCGALMLVARCTTMTPSRSRRTSFMEVGSNFLLYATTPKAVAFSRETT